MSEKIKLIRIERNTVARGIGPIERGQVLTVVFNPSEIDPDHILIGDAKALIALKKAVVIEGGIRKDNISTRPVAVIKAELKEKRIEIPKDVKKKEDLEKLLTSADGNE